MQHSLRRIFSLKLLLLLVLGIFVIVPVSAQDVVDPVPYPPGVPIGDSPELVRFNLDEILTYEALDSYDQPEWMDALVEDGTLPPVEERLPVEPQVLLFGAMSDGPGVYGGVWRDFSGANREGWNLCAGQTQGWYGVNYIYGESLVKSGPMFMRADAVEPFPNLAKSWTWSEDGTQLTMDLIEGAKWSDGAPFTSADVMFTWNDIILDDNVNSWTTRSTWQIGGEDVTLEATDDNTILWTFPSAFPSQMLYNMDFLDFNICPEHVLKPLHPSYSDNDYVAFENALPMDDIPPVSLGPWVATEYRVDEFMVMRRNPYYWKVDEAGNQLPYLDEVTFQLGSDGIGRTLGTLAGSVDHSNLENPSSYVEATTRLQDEDAHFGIVWAAESLSFPLRFNLSSSLGVENERDTALRALFRDFNFRRAVAHAIDGDGVSQAVIRGPFLRAFPGGITPAAAEFDIDSVVYYPYDPDSARALLAGLGFEDTDGDGIVNWTDGDLAGENLVISVFSTQEAPATGQVADALVLLFQDIGIQLNHRVLAGTAMTDATEQGTWELQVARDGQEYTVPFTRCEDLAPMSKTTPGWHREGDQPRELLDFEVQLVDIVTRFCAEPDSTVRAQLMSEYNHIFTENVYVAGTVIGRYGLALANRFNNIPAGSPPFYYQWTWGNVQPDQVWVAPEDRVGEIAPGTVPLYN